MHLLIENIINFIHQVQDLCRIRIHPSPFHEKQGIISIIEKKKNPEGENMEKEIFESSLETARKRANIRRVEDLKKKKNVSQPDTPKRVFQKRICVLIMSLVQTVEQRDAKGVRGKLVTLITVEPSPLSLSLSLCFSASLVLPSLPLFSQTRFLSSSSLSFIFFFLFLIRGFV